ncbi:MAG: glycerol kinase GlpK [Hyphomicrobiaceae bacterium]|nr:glycerol kinase GlpK [Hyphomicrobiaceae bacterium]
MTNHLLALDAGTTSTRAILFDDKLAPVAIAQEEFTQHFPAPGHVEHDAQEIAEKTIKVARQAMDKAGVAATGIAAIGITNQRETTVIWDRATGRPIHRAIVWQDRRTAPLCERLKNEGLEPFVSQRTGLRLDPYFSATKIAHILDSVSGARERAEAGALAFGTIDSWLAFVLTGGKAHVTDITNAARTLLFDIHQGQWSERLCAALGIPMALLPEVKPCAADFGVTATDVFGGAIAIRGMAGDQQAATIGQACFQPGMMKATYGTGCFAVLNTGLEAPLSTSGLLTTIAYQLDGPVTYALEGSIFVAGAAVQWLRDTLRIIASSGEASDLAPKADPADRTVMVPAFVGLGAPYWDPDVRASLVNMTRGTGRAEIARAALEASGFQTADLMAAMQADWPHGGDTILRVDGGMAASDFTMQRLADLLGAPVDRPRVTETTALGAAYAAGLQAGLCPPPHLFADNWQAERRFSPQMSKADRQTRLALWADAVRRTRGDSAS